MVTEDSAADALYGAATAPSQMPAAQQPGRKEIDTQVKHGDQPKGDDRQKHADRQHADRCGERAGRQVAPERYQRRAHLAAVLFAFFFRSPCSRPKHTRSRPASLLR